MQLRTYVALLILPAVLAFAGCPSSGEQQTAPANGVAAPPVATAPDTAQSQIPEEAAAAAPGDAPVSGQLPADADWQLAGFKLGMSVADARQQMPHGHEVPVQEQWKVDNDTGMIVLGTYAEPVRRMTSVLFLSGKVVAVIDGLRQDESAYLEHFDHLRGMFGEPRGDTPEYAEGRQFIYEMKHADPQPDYQYMWARPADESLYFAAYFAKDHLANLMLISAADYDQVAATMAAE